MADQIFLIYYSAILSFNNALLIQRWAGNDGWLVRIYGFQAQA
jgi:hypothetical protein